MFQQIVVYIILAVVAVIVLWRVFLKKGQSCHCAEKSSGETSCSNCSLANNCNKPQ